MRWLMMAALAGCGGPPLEGEPCARQSEVACVVRVRVGSIESRCVGVCRGGTWTAAKCLRSCGPGLLVSDPVKGECYLPSVPCIAH